jgi:hypothetical protein
MSLFISQEKVVSNPPDSFIQDMLSYACRGASLKADIRALLLLDHQLKNAMKPTGVSSNAKKFWSDDPYSRSTFMTADVDSSQSSSKRQSSDAVPPSQLLHQPQHHPHPAAAGVDDDDPLVPWRERIIMSWDLSHSDLVNCSDIIEKVFDHYSCKHSRFTCHNIVGDGAPDAAARGGLLHSIFIFPGFHDPTKNPQISEMDLGRDVTAAVTSSRLAFFLKYSQCFDKIQVKLPRSISYSCCVRFS